MAQLTKSCDSQESAIDKAQPFKNAANKLAVWNFTLVRFMHGIKRRYEAFLGQFFGAVFEAVYGLL